MYIISILCTPHQGWWGELHM